MLAVLSTTITIVRELSTNGNSSGRASANAINKIGTRLVAGASREPPTTTTVLSVSSR